MTLRKTLNLIVTVVLVASIGTIGAVTTVTHFAELGYGLLVTYRLQLPENPNAFDNIAARIASFTRVANVNLFQKTRLERLNARMQLALGKQMLSFGGSLMVTTKTGHLYDLVEDSDAALETRRLSLKQLNELNQRLSERGIPLLFGYAHTTLYRDGMLPDGVRDDNNSIADEILAFMRGAGIPSLDSRELMSGRPLDEIIYRTDAHWSAYAAFEMYRAMVDLLNEKTAVKADRNAADLANFNVEILKNAHISDIGNRLGAEYAEPDDFQLITPKFETLIHREIMQNKQMVPSSGAFEDVVLDKTVLPEAKGVPYANCYNYYGQHPDVVTYHNGAAPEGRLLIVKDSFGTPTSSFMALAVRDVIAVDLRKSTTTIEQYVEQYKPDAVMIVQCQDMMSGQNFVFIDP